MTMLDPGGFELPPIPTKRYFTIGEVSKLCDVKPNWCYIKKWYLIQKLGEEKS